MPSAAGAHNTAVSLLGIASESLGVGGEMEQGLCQSSKWELELAHGLFAL